VQVRIVDLRVNRKPVPEGNFVTEMSEARMPSKERPTNGAYTRSTADTPTANRQRKSPRRDIRLLSRTRTDCPLWRDIPRTAIGQRFSLWRMPERQFCALASSSGAEDWHGAGDAFELVFASGLELEI